VNGTSNGRLALVVLGVLALLPAGASAGGLSQAAPDTPYYSPWHYRTPNLYRLCECWHGHRFGKYADDRYAPVPFGTYPVITYPGQPIVPTHTPPSSTPPAMAGKQAP
jgi:hypothetical protein